MPAAASIQGGAEGLSKRVRSAMPAPATTLLMAATRLEGTLRSVRLGPTKSDFHLCRAGARADQQFCISPIRTTGVKGSNRRIHRETRSFGFFFYSPCAAKDRGK